MKRVLIYFIILISFPACTKDDVSEKQLDYYIKYYGNFLQDNAYSVQESGDGGLVFTGSVEHLTTGKDIVLIKTDQYGNQVEWSPKYFGFGFDDEGYSIEILEDGYLIAGTATNSDGIKDAIVIKTDLQGNKIGKEFIYGGSNDHFAMDVAKRSTNGYIVVGYSENPAGGNKSFFVITLDEELNNTGITTSLSRGEEFLRIIRNSEKEYMALGNQFNSDNESQFIIAKLNETGNIFDLVFLGSLNVSEVLSDISAPNDSTVYMFGSVREEENAETRLILKKIVNLEERWTRIITGSGNLTAKAITHKEDGSIIIAADKAYQGDKNIIIYFLDDAGNIIDSKEYGGTGDQTVEDILLSEDNLIILGGNAYEQNRMISVIKTDSKGQIW